MPREKLTDQQRKQIIADYVQTGNYCAVARAHGINDTTVRRIVLADPETAEKAEQKKAQNTADILAFMQTRKDKVCKAIDLFLDAMQEPEKIGKANVVQLATALGILVDKFTDKEEKPADTSLMEALLSVMQTKNTTP